MLKNYELILMMLHCSHCFQSLPVETAFGVSVRSYKLLIIRGRRTGKNQNLICVLAGEKATNRHINETDITCFSCNILQVSRKRYFNTQLNSSSCVCRHFQISRIQKKMPPPQHHYSNKRYKKAPQSIRQ